MLFKHHILELTTTEDKNVYLTLQNVDPITLKHISESERKLIPLHSLLQPPPHPEHTHTQTRTYFAKHQAVIYCARSLIIIIIIIIIN